MSRGIAENAMTRLSQKQFLLDVFVRGNGVAVHPSGNTFQSIHSDISSLAHVPNNTRLNYFTSHQPSPFSSQIMFYLATL